MRIAYVKLRRQPLENQCFIFLYSTFVTCFYKNCQWWDETSLSKKIVKNSEKQEQTQAL